MKTLLQSVLASAIAVCGWFLLDHALPPSTPNDYVLMFCFGITAAAVAGALKDLMSAS